MSMIQVSAFAMGMIAVSISVAITRLLRSDSNMALAFARYSYQWVHDFGAGYPQVRS